MTAALRHNDLASFPSGEHRGDESRSGLSLLGTGASPAITKPADQQWIALAELYEHMARGSADANRVAAQRWHDDLNPAQTRKIGGRLFVRGDAQHPSGLRAIALIKVGPAQTLCGHRCPPGSDTWSIKDRQRFLDTHALLAAWNEFRDGRRGTPLDDLAAQFAESPAPAALNPAAPTTVQLWAAARGLCVGERRLRDYARRLDPKSGLDKHGRPLFDGNVDRRGKAARPETCGTGSVDSGSQIPNATITDDGEIVDAAWDAFKGWYLDPRKRSIAVCYALVEAQAASEGWELPSLRTVQLRVANELPPAIADLFRKGEKKWERAHAPRIQRDYSVYRSNQEWVGDQHRFDVLVLHDGKPVRPILTAWLDMRSRVLVGWVIGVRGNTDTILAAFKRGAQEYGLPDSVTIDNGRDYSSNALHATWLDENRAAGVFPRLGVQAHFCKPFQPQAKHIERFFRTVCEQFAKLFPSYVGNQPDNRPETLYRDLRARRVEPPGLEAFTAQFSQWVREVYHRMPHEGDGMDRRTPEEVFTADPIAKRTAPDGMLDLLLMRRVAVTVTKRGVCLDGVYYGQACEPLWRLHGCKVELGIDDSDRSYVLVFDERGEFVARAEQQRLAGVNGEELREAAKRVARAKRNAKLAGPALRDRHKNVVEHALELQAQRADAQSVTLATGTDDRPLKVCGTGMGGTGVSPANLIAAAKAAGPRAGVSQPAAMPFFDEPSNAPQSGFEMPSFADGDDIDSPGGGGVHMPSFDDDDCDEPRDEAADRFSRLEVRP